MIRGASCRRRAASHRHRLDIDLDAGIGVGGRCSGRASRWHRSSLGFHWNDPIDPTVVTVYVVAPNEATRAEVDVDGWSTVVLSLYDAAAAAGITVVGPEITSMEDMSAADYIQSAPIHDTLSS